MKPTDRRLRRVLRPAARPLAGAVAAGVASSLLVVAQAWVVAGLVVALLRGGDVAMWGVAVAATLAARGLVGVVGDFCAARSAGVVGTDLRRRLTRAIVARPDQLASGDVPVLLTRGVAAAEPYLTRYLPALHREMRARGLLESAEVIPFGLTLRKIFAERYFGNAT